MDLRSTKSTSGTMSPGRRQSFPDVHRSSLEETSTGTPCQTTHRLGGNHPCEMLTENGAHIREICAATQLWSPATWSERPAPPDPSWEGNAWRGHNGVHSSPGSHFAFSGCGIFTCDSRFFRSSRNLRGNCTCSDRSRALEDCTAVSVPPAGEAETSGQGDTGCGDDGPPLCKAVHRRGAEERTRANCDNSHRKHTQTQAGNIFFDGVPGRRFGKDEAISEQLNNGSDHREEEEVVKAAAPWLRLAPLGALCFYMNEEGTQLGQSMAVRRRKHISACFYGLGSAAFP